MSTGDTMVMSDCKRSPRGPTSQEGGRLKAIDWIGLICIEHQPFNQRSGLLLTNPSSLFVHNHLLFFDQGPDNPDKYVGVGLPSSSENPAEPLARKALKQDSEMHREACGLFSKTIKPTPESEQWANQKTKINDDVSLRLLWR